MTTRDLPPAPPARALLTKERFAALLGALRDDGHALLGPTVRDGAIVLDPTGPLPRVLLFHFSDQMF